MGVDSNFTIYIVRQFHPTHPYIVKHTRTQFRICILHRIYFQCGISSLSEARRHKMTSCKYVNVSLLSCVVRDATRRSLRRVLPHVPSLSGARSSSLQSLAFYAYIREYIWNLYIEILMHNNKIMLAGTHHKRACNRATDVRYFTLSV